ncbi:hypothetical protein RI367_003663 [Sorochytrium milnesiophthora]
MQALFRCRPACRALPHFDAFAAILAVQSRPVGVRWKQHSPQWISNFTIDDIPRTAAYSLSYARSSGPGGQNVNKVNTKATLRLPLRPPPSWMPEYCLLKLRELQHNRINKADDLVISSERHRTQRQNQDDCIEKLYEMIVEAGAVPKETSEEQKQHVGKLRRAENERRIEGKKMHGQKKTLRREKVDW